MTDPEYAAARTALLDALETLADHRDSLIVVGAQAVYARTQRAGLTVAPHTTDGDLAVDPRTLDDLPEIPGLLRASRFALKPNKTGGIQPGQWQRTVTVDGRPFTVGVDLIVPTDVLPGSKFRRGRTAQIARQDRRHAHPRPGSRTGPQRSGCLHRSQRR